MLLRLQLQSRHLSAIAASRKTPLGSLSNFLVHPNPNFPPTDGPDNLIFDNEHSILSGFSSSMGMKEDIPLRSFQAFGPNQTLPPHPLMQSFNLSSSFSNGIFWCHTILETTNFVKGYTYKTIQEWAFYLQIKKACVLIWAVSSGRPKKNP